MSFSLYNRENGGGGAILIFNHIRTDLWQIKIIQEVLRDVV